MFSIHSNASDVLLRLQKLTFVLISQTAKPAFATADSIPPDADMSEMGLASIDFVEFVLSVESEFGFTILDTIAPDELPTTLAGWQKLVLEHLARKP